MTPADAIARLLSAPVVAPEWFSASFLAAIPLAKINQVRADTLLTLGPFHSLAANGTGFTLTFEGGTLQAHALLDDSDAFTALLFSKMQSPAAADRLAALFATTPVPADWFSDRMLDAVPIDKTHTILASLVTNFGAFKSATPQTDGSYIVTFEKGALHAVIVVGPDGKIEGLIFQP